MKAPSKSIINALLWIIAALAVIVVVLTYVAIKQHVVIEKYSDLISNIIKTLES